MKVKKIEFIERRRRNNTSLCDVVYDVFNVTSEDDFTREVRLELKDQPFKALKGILADGLKRSFGDKCENINSAFTMFYKEWPYSYDSNTLQV